MNKPKPKATPKELAIRRLKQCIKDIDDLILNYEKQKGELHPKHGVNNKLRGKNEKQT